MARGSTAVTLHSELAASLRVPSKCLSGAPRHAPQTLLALHVSGRLLLTTSNGGALLIVVLTCMSVQHELTEAPMNNLLSPSHALSNEPYSIALALRVASSVVLPILGKSSVTTPLTGAPVLPMFVLASSDKPVLAMVLDTPRAVLLYFLRRAVPHVWHGLRQRQLHAIHFSSNTALLIKVNTATIHSIHNIDSSWTMPRATPATSPIILMYASRLHGRVIMRAPTSASLKALLPMVSTCFLHVTGTNQPPVLCDADCSITDTTSMVALIFYVRALFDTCGHTCNRRSPLIMPCKLATVSGNALAPLMLAAQGGMLLILLVACACTYASCACIRNYHRGDQGSIPLKLLPIASISTLGLATIHKQLVSWPITKGAATAHGSPCCTPPLEEEATAASSFPIPLEAPWLMRTASTNALSPGGIVADTCILRNCPPRRPGSNSRFLEFISDAAPTSGAGNPPVAPPRWSRQTHRQLPSSASILPKYHALSTHCASREVAHLLWRQR